MRVPEALVALVRPERHIRCHVVCKAGLNTLHAQPCYRRASDHRTLLLVGSAPARAEPHTIFPSRKARKVSWIRGSSFQSGKVGLHYLDYRGQTIQLVARGPTRAVGGNHAGS